MGTINRIQIIVVTDQYGARGYSTHLIVRTSDGTAPASSSDVITAFSKANVPGQSSISTATAESYNVLNIPNPGTTGSVLNDAVSGTSLTDPGISGSYFLYKINDLETWIKGNHQSTSSQSHGTSAYTGSVEPDANPNTPESDRLISQWWLSSEYLISAASLFTTPGSEGAVHDYQKRKVLTTKLKQAPIAIQQIRKTIINGANEMIQQLRKYKFHEVSEIVRVCTALGLERAFLRGIQTAGITSGNYPILDENDIDKYIYRFNLNGGLAFQDITTPTATSEWSGGGEFTPPAFFYGNKNTILLQCIRTDGEPFVVCNGDSIEFATEPETEPQLPLVAFIPKYRAAGYDLDIPWLPEMVCEMLFNEDHPRDKCLSTIDISSTAIEPPDLNELVPINLNSFPYTGPGPGFPLLAVVNPEPKRIRMVMDGNPIDGEEVILANRFELTGTVKMNIGDETLATLQQSENTNYPTEIILLDPDFELTDGDVIIIETTDLGDTDPADDTPITTDTTDFTPREDLGPEETPLTPGDPIFDDPETPEPVVEGPGPVTELPPEDSPEDPFPPDPFPPREDPTGVKFPVVSDNGRLFSTTPINVDYTGRIYRQRDPIVGTGTKFTKELFKDDIIELQYEQEVSSGLFYTVGTDIIYYKGSYFSRIFRENIEIILDNVKYKVISQDTTSGTLEYYGYTFDYDAKYKVQRIQDNYTEVTTSAVSSNVFSAIVGTNSKATLFPNQTNQKLGIMEIESLNGINATLDIVDSYFETGDLIQLNGEYYRFQNVNNGYLTGVYRLDGNNIDETITSGSLTRSTKVTKATKKDEFTQASVLPYRVYYKVDTITNDTSISTTPSFSISRAYNGKLYRIGFNIRSASADPDLFNTGFKSEGLAQFLPAGSATDNSPVFYVPAASTEQVMLYNNTTSGGKKLTQLQSSVVGKTALPIVITKSALDGKYMNNAFDYTTFSQPLDTIIFPDNYNTVYDEEEGGELYFTDGTDKYIVLETLYENNPSSHTFQIGDLLTIRKVKYSPNKKDDHPFGEVIRTQGTNEDPIFKKHMSILDYEDCGLKIQVEDIVNPHRFKILKEGRTCSSEANKFFYEYDISTEFYLTATNGDELEYWAKYFSPVFMDGTITANSYGEYVVQGQNVNRTIKINSKDNNNDKLRFNYNSEASSVSYWLGSTGVNIIVNSDNVVELVPGPLHSSGANMTEDGTFLLSLKDDVVHPPNLLDTFFLRVMEFEPVEL